jgi:signal transduction histidine kinase
MDIDAILGRSTAYAIVVGTLLIVYAAIVRITAKSVLGTLIDQSEIQALAAVALALLFEPARTRVQRFVDRRFFRVRYNFRQAQRDLSERLQHAIELKRLGEIVVEGLGTLLLTERIAFFILDPERETMTTLAHRGFERKAWKSIAFQAVLRSGREAKPVTLPELIEPGVEFIELDRPIYATHGIALIVSVATMIPGTLALLVLGPKRSGMRFNAEDLDLITTTTIQAGTAVERITLQHDLVIEQAESLRLKELNRLKSFFVSSVSHELKTPLTSIRMFAELLQSGVEIPVEKVTRYAGTIEAESTRLTRLIDNVLDFSKIERGVKEYSFTRIELNSRVESVIESLSYQFATTGFHVAVDLYPEPIELRADGDAVTAAVVNLISNAIKYSGGRREIGVRTARRRNVATVSVSDRGIGISESEKTRIFEAFYRSSDRAASSVAGTGLGLALVHHIVAAHGGSIEVESIPGEGSTFTLLLPLPEPSGSQSSRGAEEVVAADPASYGT